ncbi:hypothetical protein TNCV_4075161 [Trichonephila clavipes]|nr:hypothetical protein TNCV_4075161 [Trichonephila clavipes]
MLQKDLERMYPLYMIFGSSGFGKALPQKKKLWFNHVWITTIREEYSIHHMAGEQAILQQKLQFFWHQSVTVNCNRSIVSERAPSQTPCSVHTIMFKTMTSVTSVMSCGDVLCSPIKIVSVMVPMMQLHNGEY